MKRLFITILSLVFMNSAFADNSSMLQVKVAGNTKSTHYVCVSNLGCLNLSQIKDKSKKFPLHPGAMSYIFLTDISTMKMYPQKLPASCNINIAENQTVVISGKVTKASNDDIYINRLQCSVVNH